jgi:hypothetical protein
MFTGVLSVFARGAEGTGDYRSGFLITVEVDGGGDERSGNITSWGLWKLSWLNHKIRSWNHYMISLYCQSIRISRVSTTG